MFTTITDLVRKADVHLIHVDPHFWVFCNTTGTIMNMLMMMLFKAITIIIFINFRDHYRLTADQIARSQICEWFQVKKKPIS